MSTQRLDFDFFGISTVLELDEEDVATASWFFRRHLLAQPLPAHKMPKVRVACGRGFFESLLAHSTDEKSMRLTDSQGTRELTFTSWSHAPSFMPPFASHEFLDRYAIMHGAALATPEGRGLVLVGRNYIGKTALTLELLKRGFHLVSDSCVVIDYGSPVGPRLRRYETPFGFRRNTLRRWKQQLAGVERRSQISEVTGEVVLAHAHDVLPDLKTADRVPLDLMVSLTAEDADEAPSQVLRVYPEAAGPRVMETVNLARRHRLGGVDQMKVRDSADRITQLL
ncbi:hypothetical protein [Streptacidiphilus anmyonensis]|uniref:hypothetical protein n=1 Tax=Streptacidiphilus anmyonensis TaxID=405782 RepID=UPI0005A8029B|nr:hypothetical protein [Streptacidiphilus anmyonensis]